EMTKVPELSSKQRGVCTLFTCGNLLYQRKDSRIEEITTRGGIRCRKLFESHNDSEIHTATCHKGVIYSISSNRLDRIPLDAKGEHEYVDHVAGPVTHFFLFNGEMQLLQSEFGPIRMHPFRDRKSTRLNSSHVKISYAVFCLKKKKKNSIDYINLYK